MTSQPTAEALLSELATMGLQLRAAGDVLQDRPKNLMTPELAERVKPYKDEILAILTNGQNREANQDEASARDNAPAGPAAVPRELSFSERVASGYVNPGWSPRSWRERLMQLAGGCEAVNPKHAADLRRWASNIRIDEA